MGDIGRPRKIIRIPIPKKVEVPEPAPEKVAEPSREIPVPVPA